MRCALATIGSRGDVEPFVLLAHALAERGHAVTLALDEGYHALPSLAPATAAGVAVTSLGALAAAEMVDAVAAALGAATPYERSRVGYRAFIGHRRESLSARLIALASTHDLVIVGDALTFLDGGRLPWTTPTAVVWYTLGPGSEYERLRAVDCLRLAALPAWLAPRDPPLAASVQFTGFWRRAGAGALPAAIARFVDAGAPPLFLTMGSMVGFDAAGLVARFVAAARADGWRMIIQKGWAELAAAAAEDVLVVDEVDYALLFPRCAALFVHGGAGTIGHALVAGRPLAVLPLVADQVAWARVVAQLGGGLGTIDPRAGDDDAALHAALARARDPAVASAAAAVAEALVAERGLDAACVALERHVTPRSRL